jgi:hypothetical protein
VISANWPSLTSLLTGVLLDEFLNLGLNKLLRGQGWNFIAHCCGAGPYRGRGQIDLLEDIVTRGVILIPGLEALYRAVGENLEGYSFIAGIDATRIFLLGMPAVRSGFYPLPGAPFYWSRFPVFFRRNRSVSFPLSEDFV